MFDRTGRDAIGRFRAGSRDRSKAGGRLQIEALEGRAMMTASISPIANVVSPQGLGYQVPVIGGTSHAQTFAVTSDNPGVKASVAQGQFLTIGVTHASSGAGDVAVSGTMTFQLFEDLTPVTAKTIESLVTGTATNLAQNVNIGSNYYLNKTFHRVASGFPDANSYIVQGGSLNGDGTGSVFASPFSDEFVQSLAFTGNGQLAMANSGRDTNDSQFFITTGSPCFLDHIHTIFGQIVAGQDILKQLTQVTKVADTSGSVTKPASNITITSASLSSVNPSGVIHLDTSNATANSTAHVTVTATDVTDGTTASQSFQVTTPPLAATDNERPFLGPVDKMPTVGLGQTYTFQLSGVAPQPGDQLTYTVQGGTTTSGSTTSFSAVTNATATVSATGLVTVKPTAGYSGPINLLVGVRDQVNRAGTGVALDSPSNYDTEKVTLTVNASATPVAVRPIAQPVTTTAAVNGPTTIQLNGSNPNTNATAPITYALTSQPLHGTISGFDATTGRLNYTPTPGYIGSDTFSYTVNDPTSKLTSFVANVSVSVTQANTGAVRFFADDLSNSTTVPGVLTVTPLPRTDGGTNTIDVTQVNGNVQITVNGVIDVISPTVANTDKVIVYGSKANDTVTIDTSLSIPVTLNGGTGGKNILKAGGGPATEMGWYGSNRLVQGSSQNFQFGQVGHVKFVKGTGTSNVIFVGRPGRPASSLTSRHLPTSPSGTFYTLNAAGKLVKTSDPYAAANKATKKVATKTATPPVKVATTPTGKHPTAKLAAKKS